MHDLSLEVGYYRRLSMFFIAFVCLHSKINKFTAFVYLCGLDGFVNNDIYIEIMCQVRNEGNITCWG